jgi:hypothetical protein
MVTDLRRRSLDGRSRRAFAASQRAPEDAHHEHPSIPLHQERWRRAMRGLKDARDRCLHRR